MSEVSIDMINNAGALSDVLLTNNFKTEILRPFVENGKNFINNGSGVSPVTNATLLKDEWIQLDTAVTKVARERLNFVQDLISMGLTMSLPNALGKTVLQYQNQSDISDATVSMDGLAKGDNDRPDYDLTSMPIPIIHKDFSFSAREIAASRNGSMPLDTSTAELAARKVAETAEKLHLGTYGTYKFGGGNIYGLTNFPDINSGNIDGWTGSSSTGTTRFESILSILAALRTDKHYGPYGVYVSSNYEQYLDEDYKAESDLTLRERILKIGMDNANTPGKIRFIKALDYLPINKVVVVQLTSDVIQSIQGMNSTVVQWQSQGGMQYNFKVMSIMVPRVRSDYNETCGIYVATGV